MKASRRPRSKFRRVGIVAKVGSVRGVRLAESLAAALRRRGLQTVFDASTAQALKREDGVSRTKISRVADLVFVIGGDGTLLSVARAAPSGVPLVGINIGLLGFLAGVGIRDALARLDEVLSGAFREDRRRRLDVSVSGGPHRGTYRVLNDAVLNREALARISTFEIALDGRTVAQFRADGVIVSTPTGSTAYNLSAGGPILHPQLPAIVMTPICPHTLAQRPLVVPASMSIRVRVVGSERRDGGVYLTLDGQEGFPILPGVSVEVRSSASPVTLLRSPEIDHFDQLAEKLSWGV
jgi:NAD+ kinase